MMKFSSLSLFFALSLLRYVSSQTTAGVELQPSNVQGEVLGTGADGTTYAISGEISGEHVTATIVQGATRLSEILVFTTSGATAQVVDICSYSSITGGETAIPAVCSDVVEFKFSGGQIATSGVTTGTIELATNIVSEITASAQKGGAVSTRFELNLIGTGAMVCLSAMVAGGYTVFGL